MMYKVSPFSVFLIFIYTIRRPYLHKIGIFEQNSLHFFLKSNEYILQTKEFISTYYILLQFQFHKLTFLSEFGQFFLNVFIFILF